MTNDGCGSNRMRLRGPEAAATTAYRDRALRVYRRRISRCRTQNQVNRVHIAVENYMTPAEVRYFRAALEVDPDESPSRIWITRLASGMPTRVVRPIEFERRALHNRAVHYTADASSSVHKTLIIGFAGIAHRLMMPTPWLLDCLNPALYDVVLLSDFSKVAYASGIHGLGSDFHTAVSNLCTHVDPGSYRNTISLGTSAGGIPAILAAILLVLDKAIAIGPQSFDKVAALLSRNGLSEEPYASLLASRPQPFPDVLLVCAAGHDDDVAAATSLQQQVPARVIKVRNCAAHAVLGWHRAQGTLPSFLAKILGQSLEEPPLTRTALATAWVVNTKSAPLKRSMVAGAEESAKTHVDPKL